MRQVRVAPTRHGNCEVPGSAATAGQPAHLPGPPRWEGAIGLDAIRGFLVLSAVLILVAIVLSGAAVGQFVERHLLAHEEATTAKVVRRQAERHLRPGHFGPPAGPDAQAVFTGFASELPDVFRLKVFDTGGRIVWSDEPRLIGRSFPNTLLARALGGHVATAIERPDNAEHVFEASRSWVGEVYVPVTLPGAQGVVGVIEAYKDLGPLMSKLRAAQWLVWAVATAGGLLLYLLLAATVARASANERRALRRLEAQNSEVRLVQSFTESILQCRDPSETANRTVAGIAQGLGLLRAALHRIDPRGEFRLVSAWPAVDGTPALEPGEASRTAVAMRRQEIRERLVAQPVETGQAVTHVFLAEFPRVPSAADLSRIRILELMLQQAAIALESADLFRRVSEAQSHQAAILAGITDRMVIVGADRRVAWMNEAAERAVPGLRVGDDYDGAARSETAPHGAGPVGRAFTTAAFQRDTVTVLEAGGERRHLDVVATPLLDTTGAAARVLEVARDVSAMVEMAEELRRTQASLVERERLAAVVQLVVGLHHSLLNPLSGVLGVLQVLRSEVVGQPDRCALFAEAEQQVRRVERLVRCLPKLTTIPVSQYVGATGMVDLWRLCAEQCGPDSGAGAQVALLGLPAPPASERSVTTVAPQPPASGGASR